MSGLEKPPPGAGELVGASPPSNDMAPIRIGDWTVYPSLNLLERNGRHVKLEPRAMEVLVHLSERPGAIVSSDELIRSVWRGRVVGDSSVYQVIAQLRHALRDDRQDVRFIQTVPKQGYRMIATVRTVEPETKERSLRVLGFRPWVLIITASLLVSVVGLLLIEAILDDERNLSPTSIAVLPFSNEGAITTEDTDFANGIYDETLTQLGKISSLTVIGRSSVAEYRNSPKDVTEIGRELSVATVLQGQVHRAGNMVRINLQLTDTENDQQLWAESYNRALTARNIFDIQNEMATSIAAALRATVEPSETARLGEIPTENTRALDLYLSGNEYFKRPDDRSFVSVAVQQYERAVREDPEFALAWAGLSRAYTMTYLYRLDDSEARLEMALDAARHAFALQPDLPQAHLALAHYYQATSDRRRALEELRLAEQGLPGDSYIFLLRALILRRTGNFEGAFENFDRVLSMDPRNIDAMLQQARTYGTVRDYARAEEKVRRALTIRPDDALARLFSLWLPLAARGEVVSPSTVGNDLPAPSEWLMWLGMLYQRDYDAALRFLAELDSEVVGTSLYAFLPKSLVLGWTYKLAGELALASDSFQAAHSEIEERISDNPEDPRLHAALGRVLAELGQNDEAIRAGRQAMELVPISADSLAGPFYRESMFRLLLATGDYSAALNELDQYLAGPGDWSIEGLLPDPRFDPIRDLPDFRSLVSKYRRGE